MRLLESRLKGYFIGIPIDTVNLKLTLEIIYCDKNLNLKYLFRQFFKIFQAVLIRQKSD
jgi:hypothetical protein